MKRFPLFLAALLLSGLMAGCATTAPVAPLAAPALSGDDAVASNGTDSVRLTQKARPPAILAMIPPQFQKHAKAASANINGAIYTACWVPLEGHVVLSYEDGDTGVLPMTEFRRSPGI